MILSNIRPPFLGNIFVPPKKSETWKIIKKYYYPNWQRYLYILLLGAICITLVYIFFVNSIQFINIFSPEGSLSIDYISSFFVAILGIWISGFGIKQLIKEGIVGIILYENGIMYRVLWNQKNWYVYWKYLPYLDIQEIEFKKQSISRWWNIWQWKIIIVNKTQKIKPWISEKSRQEAFEELQKIISSYEYMHNLYRNNREKEQKKMKEKMQKIEKEIQEQESKENIFIQ